ncbi:Phosphatidylinositol transfer protein [Klebsormidium nitens]|uniref:Phosphatidylinositol transfer protein n=1 Tax=Klebsormidium nitens TaxID=105231 RepID=A0A1Y1I3X5_KLENI|nr:Phosphatidylinositol transfer protein [Klebsormidium nitens]|eukprot:GAQ84129.1 Phosphatidylinositol transfer protein [Klebsormidium nitens]
MVQLREFRVVLPVSVEEYRVAQLYMVAKYSAAESGGDSGSDGVEIVKNEPFENDFGRGQYTNKIYHLASKLPSWLVSLIPKNALTLEEEAWNAYPRCVTVLKCPYLSKFKLQLDTMHLPDRGDSDNALDMSAAQLKKRQVEMIDIATDPVEKYVEEEDPCKFKSKKTGRGPLKAGWHKKCDPVMTAYKLVTVDVPYFGWGSSVEKFVAKHAQRKVLLEGHRKLFCWLDEWFGLSMDDIRAMEKETAEAMLRARGVSRPRDDSDIDVVDEDDRPAINEVEVAGTDGEGRGQDAVEGGTPGRVSRQGSGASDGPDPGRLGRQLSRRASRLSRSNSEENKPSLSRRTSFNSAGPSFSMGIATNSALEDPQTPGTGDVPPMPSYNRVVTPRSKANADGAFANGIARDPGIEHMPSIPSFAELETGGGVASPVKRTLVMEEVSAGYESEEVRHAILQLDTAIGLVKNKPGDAGANGEANGSKTLAVSAQAGASMNGGDGSEVKHCVSVLDSVMRSLKIKASK